MWIFDKPFPFVEEARHKLITSIGFSAFVFLFLLVFKPFGLSQQDLALVPIVAGFGLITLVVLLFSYFILPLTFPTFFDGDLWSVKKMLLFAVFQFSSIAVLNWWYSSITCDMELTLFSLFEFVYITLAVGIIPSAFEVVLMEKYLTQQHERVANDLTDQLEHTEKQHTNTSVSIKSDSGSIELEIDPADLLCIKAEGNYAKVFYCDNNSVKFKLIRNSLTNLISCFSDQDWVLQCHRSFIANFNKVEKVSGNARNYNLHIPILEFTIPVSRSFSKDIIKNIQADAHR